MAGAHISSIVQSFISSSTLAQNINDEIHDFLAVLTQLQPFVLGTAFPTHARASMIDVDQLTVTLTGCVCTFSELERVVGGFEAQDKISIMGRMKWAWAESNIAQLVQRLQNHKSSLTLMLTILTWYEAFPSISSISELLMSKLIYIAIRPSVSSTEATDSMNRLCVVIEQLAESNTRLIESNMQMSNRLRMLESTLVPKSANSASSIASTRTWRSFRPSFESALFKTRVYTSALRNVSKSVKPPANSQHHTGGWSVLSGVSLAEVSNISVLSLPVSAEELYNPGWYYISKYHLGTTNSFVPLEKDVEVKIYQRSVATTSPARRYLRSQGPDYTRAGAAYNSGYGSLLPHAATKAKEVEMDIGQASIAATTDYNRVIPWAQMYSDITFSPYYRHNPFALHAAAKAGVVETVSQLLRDGSRVDVKNREGYTPLMLAAKFGHNETVQVLLLDSPKGVRAEEMNIALSIAVVNGQRSTTQLLLDLGADREVRSADSYTPLHTAVNAGQKQTAEVLLESGANEDSKDEWENTALHLAAARGDGDIVQLLLGYGADEEAKNDERKTPMHLAAWYGHTAIVELLLKQGAHIETTDNDNNTALLLATTNAHIPTISLLLERGAQILVRDKDGNTALHLLALGEFSPTSLPRGRADDRYDHGGPFQTITQLLLENGVDVASINKEDCSALDLAIRHQRAGMLQVLGAPLL